MKRSYEEIVEAQRLYHTRYTRWRPRSPARIRNSARRRWKRLVYDRDNGRCHWCSKHLEWDKATIEHIVRIADGGGNCLDNLAIACAPCNNERHA